MTHPDWATLNDYVDGALSPTQHDDVARHVDACAECRTTVERLRSVLSAASTAVDVVEPPPQAWDAVRREIEQRKVVPLATSAGVRTPRVALRLAAAAVLLVVASSAVTVLVMNRAPSSSTVVTAPPGGTSPDVQLVSLPPDIAAAERGYLTTVDELVATLEESRSLLAPETVRAVERSLRVIDDAIAEAREALLNDPSSLVVRDLFRRGYEQKVDLLRRTTARLLES